MYLLWHGSSTRHSKMEPVRVRVLVVDRQLKDEAVVVLGWASARANAGGSVGVLRGSRCTSPLTLQWQFAVMAKLQVK